MKSDSELEKDLLTPIEAWPVPFLGCMDKIEVKYSVSFLNSL